MPTEHRVKQGECLASIAKQHGWLWKTLWDHSANAKLKAKRKGNPNVLMPGDVVVIPDKEKKDESGGTEQKHSFVRKAVPSRLRVRLLENDEPLAGLRYDLDIHGKVTKGQTDGDGWVDEPLDPAADLALLSLERKEGAVQLFPLLLGNLDPIDEPTGVQGRLFNLGFLAAPISKQCDAETQWALRAFQRKHKIPITGTIDEATTQELQKEYGC